MEKKTVTIEEVRQSLINSNDTMLFEKVELVTLNGLLLIDKIKEICKKKTIIHQV